MFYEAAFSTSVWTSYTQAQLSQEIEKSENSENYSEALLKIVIDFVTQNSEDNIDDSIVKLKAVKKVLDPDSELEGYVSPFDQIINMAKDTKEAIDNINKMREEKDDYDDYYEDEDELPPHYYGEEGEILFFDDE